MSDSQSNPTPKADIPAAPTAATLPQVDPSVAAKPDAAATQVPPGRAAGAEPAGAPGEVSRAETSKPNQPTADAAGGPRAEGARTEGARGEGAKAEASDPAVSQKDTPNARTADRDPIRDLLVTLGSTVQPVADIDRTAARDLQTVLGRGIDPAVHSDPGFRHQVAYAVQDVEKLLRERLPVSPELRTEMTEKAGSAPGLENERMLALMRATGDLQDRTLVREIRHAAAEVATLPDQKSPAATGYAETLENKLRLSPRPPEEGRESATSTPPPTSANGLDGTVNQQTTTSQRQAQDQQPSNVVINRSVLDVLLSGLRGAADGIRNEVSPPWEPPHTPMRERLAAFETRLENERNERLVGNAERTGQTALDALRGLQANESSGVLERIREAGRNNPGGLEGVLSEMRPGGRFADLRTEFNDALVRDRGFAAAYDRAAGALAQYGQDRTTVDTILTKAPDTKLADRFEALDAKIGEAASLLPSKKDGSTMLDDLTKQVSDLFQRAVDSVRSVFSRATGAQATSSGPSPSP